jgi:hypothetical protein
MALRYCDDCHKLFVLIEGRVFKEKFNKVDISFRHLYNISIIKPLR